MPSSCLFPVKIGKLHVIWDMYLTISTLELSQHRKTSIVSEADLVSNRRQGTPPNTTSHFGGDGTRMSVHQRRSGPY